MATGSAPKFVLFVSSIEGKLVRRYGTPVQIGAVRECENPDEPNLSRQRWRYRWQTDQVVAIPEDEFNRYRREYTRALATGALTKRTEAEWRKQNEAATHTSSKKGKS